MQWLYTGGFVIVIFVALRVLTRPRAEASRSFGDLHRIVMIAGYAGFFLSGLVLANFLRVVTIPGLLVERLNFFDWLTLFSPPAMLPCVLVGIAAAIIVRGD